MREVVDAGVAAAAEHGRDDRVAARRAADAEIDAPGAYASSSANCSATISGAWFGSITPPEPTRIRRVCAAIIAISTGGFVDPTDGMLWCSATQ